MEITERLWERQDRKYADFQAKLTPGVPREAFIGVRVPEVRKLAKECRNTPQAERFLKSLPHDYYDENMLHGLMISELRDFKESITAVEDFLPYVDNWAVCDTMNPKSFGKNKTELLEYIKKWIASEHTYTCRFGMEMLMTYFLDGDFRPELLVLPASVHSEEYYVNMMTAWFFATALAKQWDASVLYLENGVLDEWVHNKTIQKARESNRIPDERKAYLKTLKRQA